MNINVQKVTKVIIRDSDGRMTGQFQLGMLSTNKMRNGEIHLELQEAKKYEQTVNESK